jgi:hypothetical protein
VKISLDHLPARQRSQLAAVVQEIRRAASEKPKETHMKKVAINGRVLEFANVTGKVVGTSKNMETIVSGSVSGGPNTASAQITSTTVIHDQIFLVDANGLEHAFQLTGMNVAAREGNELTITSVMKPGKDQVGYVAAINRATGIAYYNTGQIQSLQWPPASHMLISIGGVSFSAMLLGAGWIAALILGTLLGFFAFMLYGGLASLVAAKKFIAKFNPQDFE